MLLLALLVACSGNDPGSPPAEDRGDPPVFAAAPPVLRRLTAIEYQNSVRDLFGDAIVAPTALEPDVAVAGMYALGTSVSGLSSSGVDDYETAAYDLAGQALADAGMRASLVTCTPAGPVDDACTKQVLSSFGRRAWRRPLTEDELDALAAIASSAATALGTWDDGLKYAIGAVLQSPSFLYRVELGEPDPDRPGELRYTGWEMASRLSFFLLDTTPDDELLDAAEAGELTTDEGIAAEVDRLLADPRSRAGVRAMFQDILQLGDLDDVLKDPLVYVAWSPDLIPSSREETLSLLESIIFDDDKDWRDLLVSQTTFVDRRLAALYGVPAPVADGFGEAYLPADGGRRGFLGQASFLLLESHPTTTSVTRRGLYIRERLLCQEMPDPPAGLNTSIPESSPDAPTMRDRVAVHLSVPECAACHNSMDPIGLGLENFDGIGGWRDQENGVTIDATGELDGVPFENAWDLAQAVHDHPDLSPCLVEHAFEYATGRQPSADEVAVLAWHSEGFTEDGYRVLWLLKDLALSPAFRQMGPVPAGTATGSGT